MTEPRIAASIADLATPELVASMSGLDLLNAMFAGELPHPPICRPLNFRIDRVAFGEVDFVGEPVFDATNPLGAIHGGWFATLLDSCMACAVQSTLPRGRSYTTLEFKVNIIRPLTHDSGPVRAAGIASHVGRRTGVAEGRLTGIADGKLYATGSTTCHVFDFPVG